MTGLEHVFPVRRFPLTSTLPMKISIRQFMEHLQREDPLSVYAQGDHFQMGGILWLRSQTGFPSYDPDSDIWNMYDVERDPDGSFGMAVNYHSDGVMLFCPLGYDQDIAFFYLYNPVELEQFCRFVEALPRGPELNRPIRFRSFPWNEVVKEIHLTVPHGGGTGLCTLSEAQNLLPEQEYRSLLRYFFHDDYDLLVASGNWESFCTERAMPFSPGYHSRIAILLGTRVQHVADTLVEHLVPYLALELQDGFSAQYLFDYLRYSKGGKELFPALGECLIEGRPLEELRVSAPEDLNGQIRYSASFRVQLHESEGLVQQITTFRERPMSELRALSYERKEDIREFLAGRPENTAMLSRLRDRLPAVIRRSHEAYRQAVSESDRQIHGWSLFGHLLRCLVILPLQELIHLGIIDEDPRIAAMLREIRSGEPANEATWVDRLEQLYDFASDRFITGGYLFLSHLYVDHVHLAELLSLQPGTGAATQATVNDGMARLDIRLNGMLLTLRSILRGIDIIQVLDRQDIPGKRPLIRAKKLQGSLYWLEFEFSPARGGDQYLPGRWYFHSPEAPHPVPLSPFFEVRVEDGCHGSLGMLDRVVDREFLYVHGGRGE